jgi:hypothetical protein
MQYDRWAGSLSPNLYFDLSRAVAYTFQIMHDFVTKAWCCDLLGSYVLKVVNGCKPFKNETAARMVCLCVVMATVV